MNEFERMRRRAEMVKKQFPQGTRIELVSMNDPYSPVPSGMRGTVDCVDDIGTIFPTWDDGRSLGLVYGEDRFRKLTPEELEAMDIVRKGLNGLKADEAVENVLNMFSRTRYNSEFVQTVKKTKFI